MAVIQTLPFRVELPVMRAVSLRTNYRRMAWALIAALAVLAILTWTAPRFWPVFLILALVELWIPTLWAGRMVAGLRSSGAIDRELVFEFDPAELRQLEQGEVSANIGYEDLVSFQEGPEGLQLGLPGGKWILVPRRAFATPGDYATAKHFIHQARGGIH